MTDEPAPGNLAVGHLVARVEALRRFLAAGSGHLPDDRLAAAHTAVERAGDRLALSRDYTLVALAGTSGSGKSSLFNALARFEMSPVGVRRPTTTATHACVWGPPEGAAALLDWVGVLPRHRFVRESALDGDDEADLRGLVLLDLPDLDSVHQSQRSEVDRMLGLVDLVVWVVDPQKYADRLVHDAYLRQFRRHRDITVVVLNQADLLAPADVPRVVDDLRRLLAADGLDGVPVLATSARYDAATANLRVELARAVAGRQSALRRLAGDLDTVAEQLSTLMGTEPGSPAVEPESVRQLTDALAAACGVPALVAAAELAHRHRVATAAGWPLARGLRRLLRKPAAGPIPKPPAGPVPGPAAAHRPAVGLAVRDFADRIAATLPPPWRTPVTIAARSRLDELPEALGRAVVDAGPDPPRTGPGWWLLGAVQWLVTAATLAGLGWLLVGYTVRAAGLPTLDYPMVGPLPLPTLMLLGGLLFGPLVAVLARPQVTAAARRARDRADRRLHEAMRAAGEKYVVSPVRDVLCAYEQAGQALDALRRAR